MSDDFLLNKKRYLGKSSRKFCSEKCQKFVIKTVPVYFFPRKWKFIFAFSERKIQTSIIYDFSERNHIYFSKFSKKNLQIYRKKSTIS